MAYRAHHTLGKLHHVEFLFHLRHFSIDNSRRCNRITLVVEYALDQSLLVLVPLVVLFELAQ